MGQGLQFGFARTSRNARNPENLAIFVSAAESWRTRGGRAVPQSASGTNRTTNAACVIRSLLGRIFSPFRHIVDNFKVPTKIPGNQARPDG